MDDDTFKLEPVKSVHQHCKGGENGKIDKPGGYCVTNPNDNDSGVDIYWDNPKNIKGIFIQGRGPATYLGNSHNQYAKEFKILKIDKDNRETILFEKKTVDRQTYEIDKKMPIIFENPLKLEKNEKIRILATGDSKSYNVWKSFRVGAILDQNCSEMSEKNAYKKIFDTCAIVDTKENDKHKYLFPKGDYKSKEMCEKTCDNTTDCKGYQVSRSKDGNKIGACHIFVSNDDYDIANLRPTRCVNNSTTHKTEFYLKEKQLDGLNICSHRDTYSLNCSNNCEEIEGICVNTNKCQFRTSEKECNIGGNCIYDKENGLCHTKCEDRNIDSCFNKEDPWNNKCLVTYDKKCKKLEEYDIITDYSGRYFPKLTSNTIFQRVDKNDTINKCKNLCKSKNKEYAAIQDDNACFCGNANEIKNYTFTNNNVPLITKKRTFTKEIDTDLPPRCQWITYRANKPSVRECNPRSKKVLKEFDEYVTEPTPKWVEYNNSFDSNAKGPIILKSGESVNTYTGSEWQSSIHFLK